MNLHGGDTKYFKHFGGTSKGDNNQCINPEALAYFIGLLGSVPFHDTSSGHGSFDFEMPNLRLSVRYCCETLKLKVI